MESLRGSSDSLPISNRATTFCCRKGIQEYKPKPNNSMKQIVSQFIPETSIGQIKPLGNGLINDTYIVRTVPGTDSRDYVLQRINHKVFTDVPGLMRNIVAVTTHIRKRLEKDGETDVDRKVLTFLPLISDPSKYFYFDGDSYWRLMVFIPGAHTVDAVTPESARTCGLAFGRFQAMLVDIPEKLEETIVDFHNMEYRLRQLREAVEADPVGRVAEVRPLLDELEARADYMCRAERLHREGRLPKRICHCDTKVNNMMFDDKNDEVLLVIDLDTVMPSYVFSDIGDFLRTGACTAPEDEPEVDKIDFDMNIYRAFTEGYLESASEFLTKEEREGIPYAAALFPYMQCVRFLADYINGDTYYKIAYPEHNLVRSRAQMRLLEKIEDKDRKSVV